MVLNQDLFYRFFPKNDFAVLLQETQFSFRSFRVSQFIDISVELSLRYTFTDNEMDVIGKQAFRSSWGKRILLVSVRSSGAIFEYFARDVPYGMKQCKFLLSCTKFGYKSIQSPISSSGCLLNKCSRVL